MVSSASAASTILISEDFESITPTPAYDRNGFFTYANGTSITTSTSTANVINNTDSTFTGNGQEKVEVANGADNDIQAYRNGNQFVDLNKSYLVWDFTLDSDSILNLSADYGSDSSAGARALTYKITNVAADTVFANGVSADVNDPNGEAIGTLNTNLTNAGSAFSAGSYQLYLGTDSADLGFNGTALDNVSLTAVPEPSTSFLGALAALALFRRKR